MKALIGFFMSLNASLGSRQPSTNARLSLAFCVDRVHPSCQRGYESSLWLLHAVYLTNANWGLNFLCSGSGEIEIFSTWPLAFIRLHLDGGRW